MPWLSSIVIYFKKEIIYKRNVIMKIIKKFWGLIPIIACLALKIIVLIVEKSANIVLRDTPACILFWFFILSVLVLVIYLILKLFSINSIKKLKFITIIKTIVIVLYGFAALAIMWGGWFYSAFAYDPETVVVENGIKMVARDTSYLDFSMEYYKYENVLFRGKQELKRISNRTYWIYDSSGELIESGIRN